MSISTDTHRKTLVIACGAIAHELIALRRSNQLEHLEIQCLPAHWHNTPERITPAVEEKINRLHSRYTHILVAYGDCGTGGQLDLLLSRYQNIHRLPGPHCYSFFAGHEHFERVADEEPGTFYLTDYLTDHFERLVFEGLGLDRYPELRNDYFGHYKRLMYLQQETGTVQAQQRLKKAEQAAQTLQLELHHHVTGLQPLERALRAIRIVPSTDHPQVPSARTADYSPTQRLRQCQN